jgi:hypothetical protein
MSGTGARHSRQPATQGNTEVAMSYHLGKRIDRLVRIVCPPFDDDSCSGSGQPASPSFRIPVDHPFRRFGEPGTGSPFRAPVPRQARRIPTQATDPADPWIA